jgi:hypothetical protein
MFARESRPSLRLESESLFLGQRGHDDIPKRTSFSVSLKSLYRECENTSRIVIPSCFAGQTHRAERPRTALVMPKVTETQKPPAGLLRSGVFMWYRSHQVLSSVA